MPVRCPTKSSCSRCSSCSPCSSASGRPSAPIVPTSLNRSGSKQLLAERLLAGHNFGRSAADFSTAARALPLAAAWQTCRAQSMRARPIVALVALLAFAQAPVLLAQAPQEKVDTQIIDKIKEEGLKHSQVMETISFLTDVHGPRLTASPQTRAAAEWTKERLTKWGLEN